MLPRLPENIVADGLTVDKVDNDDVVGNCRNVSVRLGKR